MRVQIPSEADHMLPFTMDVMCDPSVHSAPGVKVDQLSLNEGNYQGDIIRNSY